MNITINLHIEDGQIENILSNLLKQNQKLPPGVVTFDQLKNKLMDLSKSGKAKQVKELLNRHGVTKISHIQENQYQEIMDKANSL